MTLGVATLAGTGVAGLAGLASLSVVAAPVAVPVAAISGAFAGSTAFLSLINTAVGRAAGCSTPYI